MTPKQEAILDLAVEQVLSPALTHLNQSFVQTMLSHGLSIEAIMTELVLSGEVERSYRLLREVGFVGQMGFHSPTSQYGQLSRRGYFDHLDMKTRMGEITENIANGKFADEWDAEAASGHEKLGALLEQHAGPSLGAFEMDMRNKIGVGVLDEDPDRSDRD